MPPLSVVIITYNEERDIGRCLASVKGIADELIVVDSFSTDGTEDICRKSGATFFKRTWDDYASARNFGAAKARNDLILSLDADEELSPELQRSIAAAKVSPDAWAGKFVRLSNYCGKWIRHGGWYPDIKIRIYDRKKAQWRGRVHEELEGIGENEAVLLAGECLHFSYDSVAGHCARSRRYARLSAEESLARGKRSSLLHVVGNPFVKFVRDYILRLGFLDGKRGLQIAAISAWGTFLKYATLRRLRKRRPAPPTV
ncbi:MAG: glycosyltransferase family 2 protein [Chitinispirillaceae bacterium]|nr:glycosyltransferase family 2 protein [Chitinispirillaceae bacterium]